MKIVKMRLINVETRLIDVEMRLIKVEIWLLIEMWLMNVETQQVYYIRPITD